MRPSLLVLTIVVTMFVQMPSLYADIIASSILGEALADFDAGVDDIFSPTAVDSISANEAANNSFTQTNLDWNWDGNTLVSSTLLTESKTVSARPGGDHRAISDLSLMFTIDSPTDYVLDGTWGLDNASGTDDELTFELTSTAGIIINDSSTGTAGISSDTFGATGTLLAGSYTLTFHGELLETFNNQDTASGGWMINEFTLTPVVAIPEPTALFGLALSVVILSARRQRAI